MKSIVLDGMCGALIKHCEVKQIEQNQTVDPQFLVCGVSFAHLNSLQQWTGLRNADQLLRKAVGSVAIEST